MSPPVLLNENGAWCWFQGERAVIVDGKVIIGSIADGSGAGGETRDGNVELTTWDLASNAVSRVVLHERFEGDDHDAPALYVRRDGRLLAVYGKHGTDSLQRWRISDRAADATSFGEDQTLDLGASYCYHNVYRLSAENGRLYNFHRGGGWNPNYCVSDDDGTTWRYGGRLLTWPRPTTADPRYTGFDGGRPYARYASNGVDAIHILVTEDHPRAYDNSLYHAIIRGGQICHSDGESIAPLSTDAHSAVSPQQLTRVFKGDADHVAWCSDLRLDSAGRPYATFSVQTHDAKHRRDGITGGEDIRYGYARFDGERWHTHEIAFAGRRLYAAELDYSGLATLHPYNPDTIYIATNADPRTGTPLISSADGQRHHEIFRGDTTNRGAAWTWTAITADSRVDNLRPIVPPGDPKTTVLIWFRGSYRSYTDFATEVVGIVDGE